MTDICKICGTEAITGYAAGFDIWRCPTCGAEANSRNFYDHFREVGKWEVV